MKDLYGYKRYRKQLLRGLRRYNRFSRFCRIAEKLSRESFKNTRRYMRFFSTLSLLFVISFLATRDWYHGWYGILCTFFDVSVFDGMQFDWSLIWEFGKLFFQLGMLIVFVFAFINIFKRCQAKHYERRYYAQAATCMENQHSVCFTGPPGSGKSSSGGDWAVNVAMRRWEDLKYEYHTKKRQLRNYARLGQTEELEKFKALEEAYTFFKSRERWYVPCLATTFGMRVGGRYTYKANNSFFTQQQRIPEYCVIFDDEAGGSKGADTSSKVADNVADFYRYVRHYGDFILIMTEQGDDGTGKYIRKCLDDTIYCKSQKWVVRPGFLLRRWQKMRHKLIRREEKGKYRPRYNAFVYYFGRSCERSDTAGSISAVWGTSNTATAATLREEKGSFFCPRALSTITTTAPTVLPIKRRTFRWNWMAGTGSRSAPRTIFATSPWCGKRAKIKKALKRFETEFKNKKSKNRRERSTMSDRKRPIFGKKTTIFHLSGKGDVHEPKRDVLIPNGYVGNAAAAV